MKKTIIFVLLCGKSYHESITLNSMMKRAFNDTDLVIVNRGPEALRFDKSFIHTLGIYVKSIVLKEIIDTRPLSDVLATLIAETKCYDRYIFLNDDVALHKNYLTRLDAGMQDNLELQIHNVSAASQTNSLTRYVTDNLLRHKSRSIAQQATPSPANGLIVYRTLVERYTKDHNARFEYSLGLSEQDKTLSGVMQNKVSRDVVMQSIIL